MTDTTDTERELRTLLANVRTWHSPGDAPYRLADAMATTLDDNATLRARVEELERELASNYCDVCGGETLSVRPVCTACDPQHFRMERDEARARLASAKADWLAVAEELGCIHEQSMGPIYPGSRSEVVGMLQMLKEHAIETAQRTLRAEAALAGDGAAREIDNGALFAEVDRIRDAVPREAWPAPETDPRLRLDYAKLHDLLRWAAANIKPLGVTSAAMGQYATDLHNALTGAPPDSTPVNVDLSTPWGRPEVVLAERERETIGAPGPETLEETCKRAAARIRELETRLSRLEAERVVLKFYEHAYNQSCHEHVENREAETCEQCGIGRASERDLMDKLSELRGLEARLK